MSRLVTTILLVTLLVAGCSYFIASGRDDDVGSTPVIPATTSQTPTSRVIPGLPTPTPEPTPVLPEASPHAGMPRTVPLAYFHIAPENNEPADFLAQRASFITLTHGDEEYSAELRQAGYTGRILQFLVASEVNGPGPYADASAACDVTFEPLRNGMAREPGTFCREIHPHEDWFLHNAAGERLYDRVGETGVWYHMNPASPGWQEYALARIRADSIGPDALGFDGILLDNVELSLVKVATQLVNSDGEVREFDSDAAYRDAWIDYLTQIYAAIGDEVEVWANMAADPNDGENWKPYMQHLDGAMFPAFATGYRGLTPDRWENNLRQATAVLEMGKGIVAVGLGARSDTERQEFALASFLLVHESDTSFFRYVSSESREALNSFWMYDNYEVTLGEPLGPRYRTDRVRGTWRRDFTCGYVLVDPSEATGSIVQTECADPE